MVRSLRIAGRILAPAATVAAILLLSGTVSRAQSHLEPGERSIVFGVGSLGLSVREGPGFRFPLIAIIAEHTGVDVLEGPAWSSHIPWYLIGGFDKSGRQGWAAGNYLQPKEEMAETVEARTGDRSASARGSHTGGKSFIALVTAYSIRGRTASGAPTEWGVVAVDPSVIPLGSKIQVDGFEETFVAADTGSAVKGNCVDIWFPSYDEARQFGTQSRRVTIVEP